MFISLKTCETVLWNSICVTQIKKACPGSLRGRPSWGSIVAGNYIQPYWLIFTMCPHLHFISKLPMVIRPIASNFPHLGHLCSCLTFGMLSVKDFSHCLADACSNKFHLSLKEFLYSQFGVKFILFIILEHFFNPEISITWMWTGKLQISRH